MCRMSKDLLIQKYKTPTSKSCNKPLYRRSLDGGRSKDQAY